MLSRENLTDVSQLFSFPLLFLSHTHTHTHPLHVSYVQLTLVYMAQLPLAVFIIISAFPNRTISYASWYQFTALFVPGYIMCTPIIGILFPLASTSL